MEKETVVLGFDPQALTSLTEGAVYTSIEDASFDPQALTSLTDILQNKAYGDAWFRSTGSYEPDPKTSAI